MVEDRPPLLVVEGGSSTITKGDGIEMDKHNTCGIMDTNGIVRTSEMT